MTVFKFAISACCYLIHIHVYQWFLLFTGNMGPESHYLPSDMVPPSSPEPLNLHGHDGHHFPGGPPRSFGALSHHAEMAGETWG